MCSASAGGLFLKTEFGCLEVSPGEVVVVPRGVRFTVALMDGAARGYVLEVFQGHFVLPDLGPIGGCWGVGCEGLGAWGLVCVV